ncbi:MAG: ribose 5-phosphate isomerase B [Candidatus Hydrogenedens sp.]|nr:ribose 5-phosphate isomerase B [Candidatus Hydrogenedens sp.]
MIIAVGSDHAGYEAPEPLYKPSIISYLESLGHVVIDCGTSGTESVDYPDFADAVCEAILNGRADCGVLICGTGIGIGMAANRHRGIRAATCTTTEMVRLARAHNDANILAVGRRILPLNQCFELISLFLSTPFEGGERHSRRIGKMG